VSPGELDPLVVRRHLLALRAAVAGVERHQGRCVRELEADSDLRLYPVRANKLGEAAGLNRKDAKIAEPERSRSGDVPALASNPCYS